MNLKIIRNHLVCSAISSELVHLRLGNCPIDVVKQKINNNLISEVVLKNDRFCKCEEFIQAKARAKSYNDSLIKTNVVGITFHVDSY
jgi:hypothetical protein